MTLLEDLYLRHGQSPWIDNIRRDWLNDGTLADLVARGVRGVTSNPSIFAKALATSSAYDAHVREAHASDPEELFEILAVADVRDACDVLAPVYEAAAAQFAAGARRHGDGFVSLEVSPRLAHDDTATVEAATRLAAAVGRGNLMVKIPATRAGLPAVSAVLGAGISVNVTLIFSVQRYEEVLNAWMAGLESAADQGRPLGAIASVASFFVSRVDTAVDPMLAEGDPRRGTTANAQVAHAYQRYLATITSPRALDLIARGAQVQRPLWASTSVKNPDYPDLLYVDTLVAPETVNTMPDATLAAAQDHGRFDDSWLADSRRLESAVARLAQLPASIDLDEVTARLEDEGVRAFVDAYEELLDTVARKIAER